MADRINETMGMVVSDSCLESPPSIILYSGPGAGKTTCAAQSFQNMLWIVSEPDALRYYESLLRDKPSLKDEGFCMPEFKVIPEWELRDGKLQRVNNRLALHNIITRYIELCNNGKCPYSGIVVDQYNTFASRVYEDMKADASYGRDAYARINALKAWNSMMCQVPRISNRPSIFLCHEAAPKFDEEEGSPTYNQMRYKGGPAFPIGTEREAMCAMSTICIRILLEGGMGGVKRSFMTEASPMWNLKFRDCKVASREELNLRALLVKAGYSLGAAAAEPTTK